MTMQWEKVFIFISSTFNDMHAERDYLIKRVFPQLRDWCERRKLRLVDIDLRWGVTEQDALYNKNVVKVCLDRIDDCRPFFLCFLGQRRGWVPAENDISDATFEDFPDLKSFAGTTSVTEMEILHALIHPLHRSKPRDPKKSAESYDPAKHSFFYLRDGVYLDKVPNVPPQLRQIYTNESVKDDAERAVHEKELDHWRNVEIPKSNRPLHHYTASWDTSLTTPELLLPLQCPSDEIISVERWRSQWKQAKVMTNGTDIELDPVQAGKAREFNRLLTAGRLTGFNVENKPLSQVIVAELQNAIAIPFPNHIEVIEETDLQKEMDQQEQFLFVSSEGFIRREGDFDSLDAYVNGDSNQLFALTAPGGIGKSTLLSNWIVHHRSRNTGKNDQSIHFRFIGQSDRSTTVYSLLQFLLREMKEVSGMFTQAIPDDPQKLRQELLNLLEAAGKKSKTVIVLDALNQLESGLADLAWLPYQLPENVKVIVSFKRGDPVAEELYQHMQGQVILSNAKPFVDLDDRRKLVKAYLSQFLKDLDERHLETLIQSPGAENPLFLKVVLSELRVFGAFANLGEKIRLDFGETPITAFQGVIKRLENDPGYSGIEPKQVVPLLFGLLAHARQGLSAEELTGLLIQVLGMEDNEASCQAALDSVYLYLRQVRPFLVYRDGSYDFFFESFRLAAQERYVGEKSPRREAKEWHRLLAKYFVGQPLMVEKEGKLTPYRNKLSEQSFQCTQSNCWSDLYNTLTDFDFLESKCRNISLFALETDFGYAITNWAGDQRAKAIVAAFAERTRIESHRISQAPELLFPLLYNHLMWLDLPDGPIHTLCERGAQKRTNWLRVVQNSTPAPKPEIYSSEGHSDAVTSIAMSPNGVHIATGSLDKTVKIWERESGRLLRTLEGHTDKVLSVAVTPDNTYIISGSMDETVKVWEIDSGLLVRTIEGHKGYVNEVALTPDGKYVISASDDSTVKAWELTSGRLVQSFEDYNSDNYQSRGGSLRVCRVHSVVVTPDGKRLIACSDDFRMLVWDFLSGKLVDTLRSGHYELHRLAITPDGAHLVFCWDPILDRDSNLGVWDLIGGCYEHGLYGYTGRVYGAVVSPDGAYVIAGAGDKTVKVWELKTGELVRSLEGHTGLVRSVAMTPDNAYIVSGSGDHTINIWELESGQLVRTLDGSKTPPKADETSNLNEVANTSLIRSIEGHTKSVNAVALTPDGKQAISASDDGTVKVWDVATGQLIRSFSGRSVAVTPDGEYLVSGSAENKMKVWELATGKLVQLLEGETLGENDLFISLDGIYAISSHNLFGENIWELSSEKKLMLIQNKSYGLSLNEYPKVSTPDGKFVISVKRYRFILGNKRDSLTVREFPGGKFVRGIVGDLGEIYSVAITPDNQYVITGAMDKIDHTAPPFDNTKLEKNRATNKTLKVWELANGQLVRSLDGHFATVRSVAITQDSSKVISVSDDRSMKIWELATGNCHELYRFDAPINSIALSQDNRWLVCGSSTGAVWIFEWMHSNLERLVVTAYRIPKPKVGFFARRGELAFGCPICHTWTSIRESLLGNETSCPNCGKPVKLNPFTIQGDWHLIAKAWTRAKSTV